MIHIQPELLLILIKKKIHNFITANPDSFIKPLFAFIGILLDPNAFVVKVGQVYHTFPVTKFSRFFNPVKSLFRVFDIKQS